jgi:cellulose biosynthesis protein BcsQ
VAAQGLIVPALPSALDLRGVKIFITRLDDVRELNPGLDLLGILLCQYVPRLTLHREALEALQAVNLPVIGTIARSVKMARTAGMGEALQAGPLAEQYQTIAQEVDKWLKNKINQ